MSSRMWPIRPPAIAYMLLASVSESRLTNLQAHHRARPRGRECARQQRASSAAKTRPSARRGGVSRSSRLAWQCGQTKVLTSPPLPSDSIFMRNDWVRQLKHFRCSVLMLSLRYVLRLDGISDLRNRPARALVLRCHVWLVRELRNDNLKLINNAFTRSGNRGVRRYLT